MAKDNVEGAPRKKGKFKKLLLIGVAAIALIGAGAGAGIYFGALQAHEAKPEDKYPKLVLRSDDDAEPVAEGPGKEAPLKVGTVSVPNDRFTVDPRKYEIPYYPFAETFTTTLADGSGFVPLVIGVSTFSTAPVINTIKTKAVP